MRNKKALFEFIWDEIIYGVGGDGEGYIFLKDTPAETLAKEFYKWVDSEKGLQGFTLSERDGHSYFSFVSINLASLKSNLNKTSFLFSLWAV